MKAEQTLKDKAGGHIHFSIREIAIDAAKKHAMDFVDYIVKWGFKHTYRGWTRDADAPREFFTKEQLYDLFDSED